MSANAPTGSARTVRHFTMPSSLAGKVHAWRFHIARRIVQFAVILAFFGTAHWGWKLLGQPFLAGNLSAANFVGALPLADPFAILQVLATRHALAGEALTGAAIVFAVYFALGGRVFCAWVCPMNVVTDAARWVRLRLAVRDVFAIPPGTRYAVLGLTLAVSAMAGVAAFEWISPIAMLHRELVYGAGLGLTSALGVFLFDAFVAQARLVRPPVPPGCLLVPGRPRRAVARGVRRRLVHALRRLPQGLPGTARAQLQRSRPRRHGRPRRVHATAPPASPSARNPAFASSSAPPSARTRFTNPVREPGSIHFLTEGMTP